MAESLRRTLMRRLADNSDARSLASRMRQTRHAWFLEFIADLASPVRIIDVGGSEAYYEALGFTDPARIHVTLLNVQAAAPRHPNFVPVVGDGRDLRTIGTGAYDVAFSNSTIEHVGALGEQRRFAGEIMRVGRRYFVQTPYRYFPIEPHFLVPGFQFLPAPVRALWHSRMRLGWWPRAASYHAALEEVESIRLLKIGELRYLFPHGSIRREKYCGLTKSLVVTGGRS